MLTGTGFVLRRQWFPAAIFAVLALIWAASLWHRRKRRRTLRALGGKALARLAAMLGALRDRVRPRQVLRPVPGGAR